MDDHSNEPGNASQTAPPTPTGASGLSKIVLLVGGLLVAVGGGVGGWFVGSKYLFVKPLADDKEVSADTDDKEKSDRPDKDRGKDVAEGDKDKSRPPLPDGKEKVGLTRGQELTQIDEWLQEGRYAAALDGVRQLSESVVPVPRPVRYRAGLCLEALDRPTESIPHYRACVGATGEPYLQAAAQFGLARALLRTGQGEEGRALLCALLCRSSDPRLADYPYRVDASCLLALSLGEQALGRSTPSATGASALANGSLNWAVERYVLWGAPPPGQKAPTPGKPMKSGIVVNRTAKSGNAQLTDANVPRAEVSGTLEELCKQAGLTAKWGVGAKEATVGRSLPLICKAVPLEELIDWLTLPYGTIAALSGKTLAIEQASPTAKALRSAVAGRNLKSALTTATDHPRVGDVYVSLGNLDAQAGKPADAIAWYEKLASERSRSSAVVPAFYNLGLLRLSEGERTASRTAILRSIDQTPGNELAGLSYWWMGRSYLDERDYVNALRHLERARQADPRSATATAAVLAQVCMLLLQNEPRLGYELLRENRLAIRRLPFASASAFLDAYSRYLLVAGDATKSRPVAAELIAVLVSKREESWLGPAYPYLQGQAMRALGLNQEMIDLYDRTRAPRTPFADEMALQSAEVLITAERLPAARPRLEALTKSANAKMAGQANLRLAEVDLRAGRAKECLARCRALLAAKTLEPEPVLSVMGRAYTALRDYSRAAQCFAGAVPASES